VLAKHFNRNESCKAPYLYDIQENHLRLGLPRDTIYYNILTYKNFAKNFNK